MARFLAEAYWPPGIPAETVERAIHNSFVAVCSTPATYRSGSLADWDEAYHERAADARKQEGWVDLHLLVPVDDRSRRVVVGTWRDRDAWERWHTTETFLRTRDRLDAATAEHGEDRWFEVVEEKTSA